MPRACVWASRAKAWQNVPGFAATQSANGKRQATSTPGAMYAHLCRVVDILEGEGARFSGDGVSALSSNFPLYQLRTIARVYISVWIWLLGSVTPAYPTQGINLRRSYDGAPPGCFSGR